MTAVPAHPSLAPVVVVVDRGGSTAAVRYGGAEALRTGRPLRLVHVAPSGDSWLDRVGRDSLHLARARADAQLGGRVVVEAALLEGSHLPEVVAAASSAAVVVMELRRPGEHRRPAESPAVGLASATDTPVVVVPAQWTDRERGVVTVGLDPGAADDTAVCAAMTLARLRHAVLRVVVVGAAGREDVEARLQRLGGDGCDLAVELTQGTPVDALLQASASSDLLVVGRHRPRHPEGSRLGALGRDLLDRPVCPVLLTAPGHVHDHVAQTPPYLDVTEDRTQERSSSCSHA